MRDLRMTLLPILKYGIKIKKLRQSRILNSLFFSTSFFSSVLFLSIKIYAKPNCLEKSVEFFFSEKFTFYYLL